MDRAKQVLKDIFGYNSYRFLQEEIINNVLSKKDSLVVMPTGGGKSLCYQIPALIFDGLTIVISPLISLMKDQVEQLKQLGVNSALLNSSLSPEDYLINFESIKKGRAKLLYLAPESLVKEEISNLLNNIQIDCITVDEAHCISEWGHDFRKDYRQLGKLRNKFSSAVCIGLTATATPRVQNDIIKNLNLSHPKKFIASFNRENLFLQVIPKRDSFQQTVDFIRGHPNQSGIIYCFSRKQVDNLNHDLSYLGFSTRPYHAGLSDEERNKNQDLFIRDEIQIIIATIAFGMGINKSNVRFVLHHDLPKNIESYYQEIGRSGRDGVRSDCLLLFSYSDIAKINYFIAQKKNDAERISAKLHLEAMVKYSESEICRRKPLINYFGEIFNNDFCGMCDNCIGGERELTDITIPAQKFLSAVKRTGEVFGANYIIDVLQGAESDRIFGNGHQNLSVYGIGKDFTKRDWQRLLHQFINKELLIRDIEYGSLKLTEKAYDVLLKNEKIFGQIKEKEISTKKLKVSEKEFDNELFEILRKKRKEIADLNNVPPYVIFTDKSLIQMSAEFPQNEESFLSINGVGKRKFINFGEIFLSVIKNYCRRKNIVNSRSKENQKINRINSSPLKHKKYGEDFNNGKSIDKLAEENNVKSQTVISNLERFADEGNELRIEGLFEKINLPVEDHQKVFNEFNNGDVLSLKSIYEKFNGEISYQDLRLLKIVTLIKVK